MAAKRFNSVRDWLWYAIPLLLASLIVFGLSIATKYHLIDTPMLLVNLVVLASLGFILLDYALFRAGERNGESSKAAEESKYRPNLQMWATGFILGIAAGILYLLTRVVLLFVECEPYTSIELIQNIALLVVLSLLLFSVIWGIVRASQPF